jgi:hypothetical protein
MGEMPGYRRLELNKATPSGRFIEGNNAWPVQKAGAVKLAT